MQKKPGAPAAAPALHVHMQPTSGPDVMRSPFHRDAERIGDPCATKVLVLQDESSVVLMGCRHGDAWFSKASALTRRVLKTSFFFPSGAHGCHTRKRTCLSRRFAAFRSTDTLLGGGQGDSAGLNLAHREKRVCACERIISPQRTFHHRGRTALHLMHRCCARGVGASLEMHTENAYKNCDVIFFSLTKTARATRNPPPTPCRVHAAKTNRASAPRSRMHSPPTHLHVADTLATHTHHGLAGMTTHQPKPTSCPILSTLVPGGHTF